ncbi:MAG TPA: protein kinase [Blastocatellia bacterium]|nr:protein kinase [Blastocatellia bacterium]
MKPQVEELCLRALDLEPDEREAWLATACAGDEALRREVSSLLAQEERAEQLHFLEQPASKLMADWLRDSEERTLAEGPAEAASPSAAFVPGERILHYLILEPLGAGGSGRVFLARDEKLLRPVAIKCLTDELAQDKQWLARFRREARALASLNHPSIATIHALEQSGDTLFLVMEYVEGQTLLDRFRAGRLPVSETLALYNRAIAASHSEEAYNGRGVLYFYRHDYERAAADFQRARDLHPNDALFHANLANARYWIPALRGLARTDYGRAISLRREELRDTPQEPSLRAQLAVWLARRGDAADLKEARDAIELALVQAPADLTCLVSSVFVWQLTGDHERAVSQAIEAVRKGCNPDELRRDPGWKRSLLIRNSSRPFRQNADEVRSWNRGRI